MQPKAIWAGLTCHTHQCYQLSNTEWSNSSRWAWTKDRWLWRERIWEKEGFKTRLEKQWRKQLELTLQFLVWAGLRWRRRQGRRLVSKQWTELKCNGPQWHSANDWKHCSSCNTRYIRLLESNWRLSIRLHDRDKAAWLWYVPFEYFSLYKMTTP